jgi:hypothetical protein
MYEFEKTSGLYEKEVDLVIAYITEELILIRQNKKNLIKFSYSESIKGKLLFIDYQRVMSEIIRMSMEIEFLEDKRQEHLKIKENR